jgi:anti-anti-sigma regulatory factor
MGFRTLDALARLVLSARRRGLELRVVAAPPALRELVALAGLDDALGLEPERQPEEREEPLRVEEEGEVGDRAVQ